MLDKTFDSVPDCLVWQGEIVYLVDIVHQDSIQEGLVRYDFATRLSDGTIEAIRLRQWQFPNNPLIDWQRLEDENRAAPAEGLAKYAPKQKRATGIEKRRILERLMKSDDKYKSFLDWLEKEGSND